MMLFAAYYHHTDIIGYVFDLVLRKLVYRAVDIGTHGWGFMAIVLAGAAAAALVWGWNRRRA